MAENAILMPVQKVVVVGGGFDAKIENWDWVVSLDQQSFSGQGEAGENAHGCSGRQFLLRKSPGTS